MHASYPITDAAPHCPKLNSTRNLPTTSFRYLF